MGVAQGLQYLHSHGLHHGGLHAVRPDTLVEHIPHSHFVQGAIFVNECGHAQIGSFSMCSKFELNPPLNLVVRLMGQGVLRCMAPEVSHLLS
jgi:hypothetical protein